MKKNLLPLLSTLGVVLISIEAARQLATPSISNGAFPEMSAAQFGHWLYATLPARPELLLPLAFVVALLSVAAIAAHHLREDQWLNEIRDLSTREPRRLARQPRQARLRRSPVSARLVHSRAL